MSGRTMQPCWDLVGAMCLAGVARPAAADARPDEAAARGSGRAP